MEYLKEVAWLIGGPQGSGVDSSATTFARTLASGGFHIFGGREYHSNIKGEHSYYQIRGSEKEVRSSVSMVHMLATFEEETLHIHREFVIPGGAIIFDPSVTKEEEVGRNDVVKVAVPYMDLIKEVAKEFGKEKDVQKLAVMKNVLSVAASFAMFEYPFDRLAKTVQEFFKSKKPKLAEMNVRAAEIAYNYVREKYGKSSFPYRLKPLPVKDGEKRIFLNGTQAAALGKIVAGCRFQTYYPITPASDESEYLESHSEHGVVVVQCEDEISSICMAIGAAITGVRASTATSGPGFCLMVEGMGWSGINEVPVVIFDYQRAGPSTGLPTRFEQGDLKFALSAGHGDFPRILIAPGDMDEYFFDAIDAFNYAEKYQMPVIVMNDKNLANSTKTVSWYDYSNAKIERGFLLTEEDVAKMIKANGAAAGENGNFKRFKIDDSGISPRPVPGIEGGVFWNTGDEHDEYGHITEQPVLRRDMMDKRMRKLDLALKEIPANKKISTYGPKDADCLVMTWGSTKGAILDAMEDLEKEGIKVRLLQIHLVHPFPLKEVTEELNRAKLKIGVEMNFSGHLCGVVREHTGIAMDATILKYTGRPMKKDEIIDGIRNIVKKAEKKVVLTHGA